MSAAYAALSGIAFALIPVGIRGAASRGIEPRLLLLASMPVCALVMLPGVIVRPAPAMVWLAGACNGLEQFGAILAMRWGLRHGPMAPLWSAQMLGFVLVVVWGWWWLGDTPGVGHWIAIAAALASVTIAAGSGREAGGTSGRILPFAVALAALWLLNGATNATFTYLATLPAPGGSDLMSAYGDTALVSMYLVIAAGAAIDLALRPVQADPCSTALFAGVVAAGSLAGLMLLRLGLNSPAATVFTVNTAASLLAAGGFAWLFWREAPTRNGWISLACALAAVVAAVC